MITILYFIIYKIVLPITNKKHNLYILIIEVSYSVKDYMKYIIAFISLIYKLYTNSDQLLIYNILLSILDISLIVRYRNDLKYITINTIIHIIHIFYILY